MLEVVGHAVVMENGNPTLKKLLHILPNQMMNLALLTPLESGYYKKCTITS